MPARIDFELHIQYGVEIASDEVNMAGRRVLNYINGKQKENKCYSEYSQYITAIETT